MSEHRVAVGTLSTELQVPGAPQRPHPQLAHALEGALLAALPGALEPVLDRHEGFIRIPRLQVELAATGLADTDQLARALTSAIARALADALSSPQGPAAKWPDRDSYLADYLAIRLGLATGPRWPFTDLSPLDQLSGAQATVELAGTHPELLSLLAVRARTDHRRLEEVLDEASCRALVAALHRGRGRLLSRWPAGLADSLAGNTPPAPTGAAPARQVLRLLAHLLGQQPPAERRERYPALLGAALGVVALRLLLHRRAGNGFPTETAQVRAALDAQPPEFGRIYRDALYAALEEPDFGRIVEAEARRLDRGRATAPRTTRPAAATELSSPAAGVVLLVPGLLTLGIHRLLDAGQLRTAVLGALWGHDEESPERPDAVAEFLFPPDPAGESAEPPGVPAGWADRVDPLSRHLLDGPEGGAAWAGLLLGVFASALPGLRHGSASYLRRQFLHVPGTLTVTDTGLSATLRGPDLAVVLSMGGLSGDFGAIPWLGNRRLRIILSGVRP